MITVENCLPKSNRRMSACINSTGTAACLHFIHVVSFGIDEAFSANRIEHCRAAVCAWEQQVIQFGIAIQQTFRHAGVRLLHLKFVFGFEGLVAQVVTDVQNDCVLAGFQILRQRQA